MQTPRNVFRDWLTAIALWALLAFSLGWYYTVTYYGARGWPMPTVESLGGLILYYFSVLNVDTRIQAAHWMFVFPLVGVLWVMLLSFTAPYYAGRNVSFAWSLSRFAWASVPLSLPVPYMVYVAGKAAGPWSMQSVVSVALRRGGVSPWPWLSPLYLALALVALGCHVFVYRQVFEIRGADAWKLIVFTLILLICTLAGLGSLASTTLRLFWGMDAIATDLSAL